MRHQALKASRDEAVRNGDAMRKKLSAFEGTLGRVSQDTRAVLEQKEADLRRFQAERKEEQEALSKGRDESRFVGMRKGDKHREEERERRRECAGKRFVCRPCFFLFCEAVQTSRSSVLARLGSRRLRAGFC